MSRPAGRRPALVVMAFILAASSWAGTTTRADAQTAQEDLTPREIVVEDLTPQEIMDLYGVDLISQTPATISSPAVIHLHIADELSTASLRARLYAPVTTRAELRASSIWPPPTPLIAEWIIGDARIDATDDRGVLMSVPIQPPEAELTNPMVFDDARPFPVHLELIDDNNAVLRKLATFLTPGKDAAAASGPPLTVAVILDLRLPPFHLADGGVAVDPASLDRVLSLAEVLVEWQGVPLSVVLSAETLDALALVGDDRSVALLRAALHDKQLLATTWTSLDINALARATRMDVVLDGLNRSTESLRWASLEASTVMHSEHLPRVRTIRAVTEPAAGVTAFVVDAESVVDGPFPPVTAVSNSSGGSHAVVQSDPFLKAMMHYVDVELGAQWVLAELSRMAASNAQTAVVVSAAASNLNFDIDHFPNISPLEPAALLLLLDGIDASPGLSLATVDEVLAQERPVGMVAADLAERPLDPGDFDLYLFRRAQVEQRLHAYESFLEDDPLLTAPLRTLLSVSASKHLTTGERTEFLNAVDQQVTQGTTGVEFAGRGPITVTQRKAALPVTLVNNRSGPVTVALELASDTIELIQDRPVFVLEQGRNDLTVPVEATASGRTSVRVTVSTPDQAGAIILATGTFSTRFVDAEGMGFLILILAAVVLGAWWLQTVRKRPRDADGRSATVAAPGSVSGDAKT